MKSGFCFPSVRRLFPVLAALGSISCASALAQALSPEQLERILLELKSIETEVQGSRLTSRTNAVAAFQKGAASDKAAIELYLACYKEVHFDRQDARGSDFRGWREKNEDAIKDKANLAALRLQLQYLVLTLRAAENVPMKTVVPELESFAANLVANLGILKEGASGSSGGPAGRGQGGRGGHGGAGGGGAAGGADGLKRLREAVDNTVFAEAYGLDKSLKLGNWSMHPANIASLYQKTILPYYQQADPENLAAAWDRRIKLETDFATATSADNPTALETFKTENLPQLSFEKSCDLFRYASQQQGALALIAILKAHSSHPQATEWLQMFRTMLAEAAKPAGAAVPPGKTSAPK